MLLQRFTKMQNEMKLSGSQLPMWLCASIVLIFGFGSPIILSAQTNAPDKKKQGEEKLLTAADLTDEDLGIDTIATMDNLSELQSKWAQVDKKMFQTMNAFKATTDVVKQDEIRDQYQEMVKQANKIATRIKEVALLDVEKNPKNAMAVKLLMGSLANDAEFSVKKDSRQRASEVIKIGDKLIKAGIDGKYFEAAAKLDRLSIPARELFEELQIRLREAEADDLPRVKISTSKGDMVVELFENEAPIAVSNFISLVEKDFYDGLKFHRVMEGFMAQGGCPDGNGTGGPGYEIKCECGSPDARRHFIGSLSMAHAGPNTGGSQFFFSLERPETPKIWDGVHTVFGRVTEGLEVLNSLTRTFSPEGQPIQGAEADVIKSMEVIRKREREYTPRKVSDPEPKDEAPPADPTSESKKEETEEAEAVEKTAEEKSDEPDAKEESSEPEAESGEGSESKDESDKDEGDN